MRGRRQVVGVGEKLIIARSNHNVETAAAWHRCALSRGRR